MTICNNYFLDFISLLSDDFSNSIVIFFCSRISLSYFLSPFCEVWLYIMSSAWFLEHNSSRNRMRNVPEYSNHWAGFWKTEKSHRCDIITNKYPKQTCVLQCHLGVWAHWPGSRLVLFGSRTHPMPWTITK